MRARCLVEDSTVTMRARTSSPSTLACSVRQHVGAFFQEIAKLVERLLEQDRLVLPGRIGELDDADLPAGLGAPLVSGRARWRRAARPTRRAHGAGEIRPALARNALQRAVDRPRADGRRERSRPRRIRAAAARPAARAACGLRTARIAASPNSAFCPACALAR